MLCEYRASIKRGAQFQSTPIWHSPSDLWETTPRSLPMLAEKRGSEAVPEADGKVHFISTSMVDSAFLESEGMREDFAERLFDDIPVSTADLLLPSLDEILVDPRHFEIRRRVDRHLDPPLKRSDHELERLWELRQSGEDQEYEHAIHGNDVALRHIRAAIL